MTQLRPYLLPIFFALVLSTASHGDEISSLMAPKGVTLSEEVRANPPQRLFVATVDLSRVRLRVDKGGEIPNKSSEYQTTLMEPTKIAQRDHFDLVVNGDFFNARYVIDAEGTTARYRAGQWATVMGPAETDGVAWATSHEERPCLIVREDSSVEIKKLKSPGKTDYEVIAGNVMLLHEGRILPQHSGYTREPRTAIGLSADKKTLTILVVDGRDAGLASGMTYDELAKEMLRLHCEEALNLDGGGSTLLAVRDGEAMNILNKPSDGHERAVADVLGVVAR